MARHRWLWILGFALLAITPSLNAQTTTGTVRGYVKDANAAAVADAEVLARNLANGTQRSTATRSDGSYVLPGLAPGGYEVSVRKIGYTPQQRQVDVAVGATLIADFAMPAGAIELQAVTVESAPAIEMRTSEIATNITSQQLQQLPTASRNFLDLAGLAPGVTVAEDRVNSVSTRTFAAGGASPNQTNIFVDGSSLKNDLTAGGVAGQDASRGNPFPRGAIQEYRVISQNFKAEYQKASSAIITATTRSGGNEWHGNALVGYQGKDLMALDTLQVRDKHVADSIAKATGQPSTFKKPDYSRVMTALSAGGPLIRNKLFFFGSYEGNYQDRANRVAITAPTGSPALDTVNLAQYNGNFTSPFRETLLFGKLNYAIDQRSSAEFSLNDRHETDVRDFGDQRAYSTAVNFGQDVTIGQVKYNRTSGGWLNEFKIDYSRFARNPAPNAPGVSQRMYDIPNQPFPQIGSDLSVQDFVQKRVGIRNDLTYSSLEKHTFKGGVSVDFVSYDIQKLNNATPQFEYSNFVDSARWTFTVDPTQVPFNYQTPYQLIYATGAGLVSVSNTQVGAYFQDDWSPSQKLTLNLGLRWDYESNMLNRSYVTPQNVVDTLNRYNDSLPTPLDLSRYISTGSNRKAFYGAFQPRVGFSYSVDNDNRWAVFGGWGLYYDRSIFDFSVDEIQKLARPTYIVQFAAPGTTPTGNKVQWQDSYLTADTSVISSLARSSGQPEAFLLDNNTRPPKSQQFNVGVRHQFASMVAALSYQGQRGTDLFTYNWANIGLDPTGHCCVSFPIGNHGFRNFIYSTNGGKTWYDALALQLDRPYQRGRANGIGWGGGLTYTYAKRSVAGVDNLNDITSSFPGAFPNTEGIGKHSDNGGNDERHHVVANWIMDIPHLWGIQFSGLMTLGSGARQDIGTPPRFGGVPGQNYFPGAFAPQQYNFFIFGAWNYRRVDFRFRKDLPPISGTQVGVSLDVFNAFNFQNLGCYNTSNGQAGCVVSDPRRLQIAAEYTF